MNVNVEAIYRRYGPFVLRRCRFLLRHEEKAVDALHDVFVQLLSDSKIHHERGLGTLLHRMATQVCLNKLRGERRKPLDAEDALLLDIAAADDTESRTGARRLLDALFARQPVSSQEIAALYLVDGMTLEATAREVGLSVSGVRKRLRALSSSLRQLEGV